MIKIYLLLYKFRLLLHKLFYKRNFLITLCMFINQIFYDSKKKER